MTTYGTNPPSTHSDPIPNLEYIRSTLGLATRRRPWKQLFDLRALSFPRTLTSATIRLKTNIVFFQTNYAIIILFFIFLSLLWDPLSLIVFLVLLAAWLFLYFIRDEPLVVFQREVDDRLVLVVMAMLTVVVMMLTDAFANVLVAVLMGVVVVAVHGVLWRTEEVAVDEEESAGLVAAAAGGGDEEASSPP